MTLGDATAFVDRVKRRHARNVLLILEWHRAQWLARENIGEWEAHFAEGWPRP